MRVPLLLWSGLLVSAYGLLGADDEPGPEPLVPQIQPPWWQIAGNPDLGDLTSPRQQPVDFGIWQAADGSWQLWSCIRHTREAGETRLFYRWEGRSLTSPAWKPMGIAMRADPRVGETPGGLQAPYVVRHQGHFYMFYGDWEHICIATSTDGKRFERLLKSDGMAGRFGEARGSNTRDPMVLRVKDDWLCYYTAYPNRRGAVYCRRSTNLLDWSTSKIVAFGGEAGTNPYSAECPHVVEPKPGHFYLFRTQRYGVHAITRVYHSRDPMNFGIERDEGFLVARLPVAAPEIIYHQDQWFIAALNPELNGIRMARLRWTPGAATLGRRD